MVALSVLMITYNQEAYIGQAIESALDQQVDFEFEIIIGEDGSTDTTRAICREFQQKHPEIIRLLERGKNLGMMENFIQTLNQCRGEYIALLEGDDYWTATDKLQKQVEFLEKNPGFTICGHDVMILDMPSGQFAKHHPSQKDVIEIEDLLTKGSGAATCSLVFRKAALGEYPEAFKKIRGGDVPLQILCASKGKMKRLSEVMGVYRVHDRGAYYYLSRDAARQNLPTEELLFQNMFYANDVIDQYFDHRYSRLMPRMNVYPNWIAARYHYNHSSFSAAYRHYWQALPGAFPLPGWLPLPEFLRFSLALVIKSLFNWLRRLFGFFPKTS